MDLFSVENVEYRNILRYPDLHFKDCSAAFLLGPSGGGKSTLFKLFNGSISPTRGRIFYRGRDIATLDSIALRREVLLVPQQVFLFEGSIRENAALFYNYREEKAPDEEELRRYLRLCEADFDAERPCREMSGGEKQRIFLALALSLRPTVLLADELSSALDADCAERVVGNICRHCRDCGCRLLAISHDRALAERHAEEIHELAPCQL